MRQCRKYTAEKMKEIKTISRRYLYLGIDNGGIVMSRGKKDRYSHSTLGPPLNNIEASSGVSTK